MKSPIIFVDKHHEGLFNSLILLFEKRLGWKLYTQAGLQWYEEGLWNVYPSKDTAQQYLLREVEKDHGITREQFKKMNFDLILCSIPQHINPFKRLAEEKNSPLCYQIGNAWDIPNNIVKNVMASAKCIPPVQINYIEYHQEFDLNIFYYEFPKNEKKIYSFINCLNTVDLYKKDWELFLELEKLMPDWEFKSFGGQCRDGWCNSPQEVADKMREATFIYQSKKDADGFGHVIHSAMAIGRPLIVNYQDYKDKLAGSKLIPATNCINVDNKSSQQISEEIIYWSKSELLTEMGMNIYNKFKELVNYDEEEKRI